MGCVGSSVYRLLTLKQSANQFCFPLRKSVSENIRYCVHSSKSVDGDSHFVNIVTWP